MTQVSGSTTDWEATSDSFDMSSLDPGTYQWVANYKHDTDQYNTDEPGSCGDATEQVVIVKAAATGASTQTVIDNVSVSSDVGTPSGTVDFYLYKSKAGCLADDATDLEDSDADVSLDSNGDASSKAMTPDVPNTGATYWWKVWYDGDSTHDSGFVEDCGVQAVVIQNVTPPPPTP
jgi:hypothetical protein